MTSEIYAITLNTIELTEGRQRGWIKAWGAGRIRNRILIEYLIDIDKLNDKPDDISGRNTISIRHMRVTRLLIIAAAAAANVQKIRSLRR